MKLSIRDMLEILRREPKDHVCWHGHSTSELGIDMKPLRQRVMVMVSQHRFTKEPGSCRTQLQGIFLVRNDSENYNPHPHKQERPLLERAAQKSVHHAPDTITSWWMQVSKPASHNDMVYTRIYVTSELKLRIYCKCMITSELAMNSDETYRKLTTMYAHANFAFVIKWQTITTARDRLRPRRQSLLVTMGEMTDISGIGEAAPSACMLLASEQTPIDQCPRHLSLTHYDRYSFWESGCNVPAITWDLFSTVTWIRRRSFFKFHVSIVFFPAAKKGLEAGRWWYVNLSSKELLIPTFKGDGANESLKE